MTELVLPQHANRLGTAFGGSVMGWIDICGAIVASRHARAITVTAAVDELVFLAPIRVGDVVRLNGRINAAFRSSMEVEVLVEVEDLADNTCLRCVQALLTFVALDSHGKPAQVPALECVTEEEIERETAAQMRRDARLAKVRTTDSSC